MSGGEERYLHSRPRYPGRFQHPNLLPSGYEREVRNTCARQSEDGQYMTLDNVPICLMTGAGPRGCPDVLALALLHYLALPHIQMRPAAPRRPNEARRAAAVNW